MRYASLIMLFGLLAATGAAVSGCAPQTPAQTSTYQPSSSTAAPTDTGNMAYPAPRPSGVLKTTPE